MRQKLFIKIIRFSVALVFLIGGGFFPAPVQATGVVGTGTPESCTEGSLDDAFVAGGNITFDCGPAAFSFSLQTQKYISVDANIQGKSLITFDGNHLISLFQVFSGTTVTLDGVTLTSAKGSYGAIQNFGTLNITNSQILSNDATLAGGAVDNYGTLNISGSVIAHNTAVSSGGGIQNTGAVTISDSQITYNSAPQAGGINSIGPLDIFHSTIANNQATDPNGLGGGLVLAEKTVINQSDISHNTAGANGGGLYISAGSLVSIANSILRNNTSSWGGGFYNWGNATLTNTIIDSNLASTGGGIANTGAANLIVMNSTISKNSAVKNGGGIFNNAKTSLYYTTIAGNLADNLSTGASSGGGIFNNAQPNPLATVMTLRSTLLADNAAGSLANDCAGSYVTLLDYNFIQTSANCTLTRITPNNISDGDARLLSKQESGSLWPIRILQGGSPAIDAIPGPQCQDPASLPLPTDQLGNARPLNNACDIGAVEGGSTVEMMGVNLIRNGDAEVSAGSYLGSDVYSPSWIPSGSGFSVVPYNTVGGFPLSTSPGPTDRGANFFAGGSSGVAREYQDIDLSSIAAMTDTGNLKYELSGYFGGYAAQTDNTQMQAFFYDSLDNQTGNCPVIGQVSPSERGDLTGLLLRNTSGRLPVGTTRIRIWVEMDRLISVFNDGYADNLAMVLNQGISNIYLPLVTQ